MNKAFAIKSGSLSGCIKVLLLAILFSVIIAGLIGCSSGAGDNAMGPVDDISDIEVGTPKNDVVRRLGEPENWATVMPASEQMLVSIDFNLEATMQPMPAGEFWLFEYTLPNGNKYVIHFFEDKVQNVVEGPLFKE